MKLHFLDRSIKDNSCLHAANYRGSHFLKLWHYHPEFELVAIKKSGGIVFIGNTVKRFHEGDLILLGSDLPHMWLNSQQYFQKNSNLIADSLGVHFHKSIFGKKLYKSEEMHLIKVLLERSKKGLKFKGLQTILFPKLEQLILSKGFERLMLFLEILDFMSKASDWAFLSPTEFPDTILLKRDQKIERATQYILDNFKKDSLSLSEVAEVARMNPSAFSRKFQFVFRKSFSRYVNEIRIGMASKMLLERNYTIAEICFEVGFNNLSNFNRQFKIIKGKSPTKFKEDYPYPLEINNP